jgi:hypothetical protein
MTTIDKNSFLKLQTGLIAGLMILSAISLIGTAAIPSQQSSSLEHSFNLQRNQYSGVDFTVDIGDFWTESLVENNMNFQRLYIQGGGHTADYGLPELPVMSFYVAIPLDAEAQLSYTTSGYSEISDLEIYPAQPPKPETGGYDDPPFILDSSFYSTNNFYPDHLIEIGSIIDIRGLQILPLSIYPYTYNPVTNTIRKYETFDITIDFIGGTDIFVPERLRSIHFQSLYDSFLINGQIIERAQPNNPGQTIRADRADLLIVVYDDFYEEILPLAEWRHQTGLETKIVKWSTIGSSSGDLRNYLENAYDNWDLPPSFLLIVGDADHIPVNYFNTHPYGGGQTGTDLWYTAYGAQDYYPDIHAGRISVDNENELTTYVNKVLDYCKNPDTSTNWFNRVLLAAAEEYGRYFVWGSETVFNFLDPLGYDIDRQYAGGTPPGSTAGCIAAIDNGVTWANHRDHGISQNSGASYTGWSSPRFTTDHIFNDIDNGDMWPMMVSLNCESGWFDGETDTYTSRNFESIGEAAIRVPNGFIAAMAHTRVSYSGYNDEIGRGNFDAQFPDFDPAYPFTGGTNPYSTAVHRVSQIMNYAKFWMYDKYVAPGGCDPYPWTPNEQVSETTFEMLHVHGDPTVEIWWAMPVDLDVDFPTQAQYGQSLFEITVNDQSNNQIEGALVCLMQPNGIYATGLTDANGVAEIEINVVEPDEICLTVTAHNFLPFTTQIMVGSSFPPDPPTLQGPTNGRPNKEYSFTAETTDPEGSQILYLFDWGDGTTSEWIGPVNSGESVTTTHAFPAIGDYEVKVRAKDIDDATGYWSEPLMIHMDVPVLDLSTIQSGVLKATVNLRNYGLAEADEITWSITFEGGVVLLGRETTGIIPTIEAGGVAVLKTGLVIGFGPTRVTVTAEVPESSDSRSQAATIFFFYVNVLPGGG